MGISLVIARLAILGAVALLVQGTDFATGGEVYMATVTRLAQTTSPEPQPAPPPPPETSPLPSSSGGGTFLPPPGEPQPSQYTQPPSGQMFPERQMVPYDPSQTGLVPGGSQFPQQPTGPRPFPYPGMQGQPPQGQFPGMPPGGLPPGQPQGQPFQKGQFEPPKDGFAEPFDEGDGEEEFLDPRMVSDVMRQIKDMKRQVAQLLKQAKKAKDNAGVEQLNTIIVEVDRLFGIISGSGSTEDKRDAIQEFHENRFWDDINAVRRKLEVQPFITRSRTSLGRLKKIAVAKVNQNLGLNMASVQGKIGEMESNLARIQQLVAEGELEEADEIMQEFHQGTNPNEIENVIMRMKNDVNRMAKSTKNQNILARLNELRQKVIDAFNAGDYREANELLNEEMPTIQRLFQQNGRLRK